eukprot:snap_masked-scaffold_64-processed-gene-0.67-mRNA-1 protein AED:1.00 eAED:1.00 QI:0/0/0/0/1/1/2/0/376
MGKARETLEDLLHKLLSHRIVVTAKVAKFGMGNFVEFKKCLPGKSKQQIYNRLQRYLRRQSLEHLHGLKVNLDVVRRNNLKAGKYYLKNKKSLGDKTKYTKRFFNVWRYAEQHIKNNSKNFKVKLVVYDVFSIEGLKQLYSEVSQVIADDGTWDKYPEYKGDLTESRQQIKWCIKGYPKRLHDVSEGFEEQKVIVKNKFEGVKVFIRGYQLKWSKTINMVHAVNQELNVELYVWKRPCGSRYINKEVQDFILYQEEKPDVLIVDLPFKVFSSDPVRGPKVEYDVLNDAAILNLDVNGLPLNNMWFVWTIFKKKELVLKWVAKNGIRFLSRLIWVKVNEDGRILSTLGNVTGACIEEVLIGLRGQFPDNLERRFIGK